MIEPALGILSDAWRRRALILSGGLAFSAAAVLMGASGGYLSLLLATILFFPASGAFVSLSQAALMDHQPGTRVRNMTLWTLAGSVGVAAGPLALNASRALGMGWRWLFILFGALAAALLIPAWKSPILENKRRAGGAGRSRAGKVINRRPAAAIAEAIRGALHALRHGGVVRWLVLLKLADLMLDVLFGLIALYYVDVVGASAAEAAIAVTVWTVAGLMGDFLVIPLLEKVSGLTYLRLSAAAMALVFPAFLLVGTPLIKLALLAALGLLKAGWYPVLQAEMYASMPGRSGTALALDNMAGIAGGLIPIALGAVAQAAGLLPAMWLLMAGPLALLVGVPFGRKPPHSRERRRRAAHVLKT